MRLGASTPRGSTAVPPGSRPSCLGQGRASDAAGQHDQLQKTRRNQDTQSHPTASGPPLARRATGSNAWGLSEAVSCAAAEQLEQHHEQVDEVQVQAQRAHDRTLGDHLGTGAGIAGQILLLQPLRVPGGEAGEHQHADHADRELERELARKMLTRLAITMPIRPMNRNEPIPKVALGRVAVQADGAERGRGDEEHPCDALAGDRPGRCSPSRGPSRPRTPRT